MRFDNIFMVGETVLKTAKKLSGGFDLKLEEIVIQNGLMVLTDMNRTWQIALATDFERYLEWLRNDALLTAEQYEKEISRKVNPT